MNTLLIFVLLFLVIILLFTTLKYRENFSNDIICETIENKKDCHSYGCNYLELSDEDIKCIDGESPCKESKYKDDELKTFLNLFHDEYNDINIEDIKNIDDIEDIEDIEYIKLAKPGTNIENYLTDVDKKKEIQFEKKICPTESSATSATSASSASSSPTETTCSNSDIKKIDSFNSDSDSDIILDNNVKILIVTYSGDLNGTVHVYTRTCGIDNILFNGKKLNIKPSFKNCYRMGGKEVNIGNEQVICQNYKQNLEKCVKLRDENCYSCKTRDECFDPSNKLMCAWNKKTGCSYKYDNPDNECLEKNEQECNNDDTCRYYSHIDKCLSTNHDLCNSKEDENECKPTEMCNWNTELNKCKPIRNIKNMKYNNKYNNLNKLSTRMTNAKKGLHTLPIDNLYNEYSDYYIKQNFRKY